MQLLCTVLALYTFALYCIPLSLKATLMYCAVSNGYSDAMDAIHCSTVSLYYTASHYTKMLHSDALMHCIVSLQPSQRLHFYCTETEILGQVWYARLLIHFTMCLTKWGTLHIKSGRCTFICNCNAWDCSIVQCSEHIDNIKYGQSVRKLLLKVSVLLCNVLVCS